MTFGDRIREARIATGMSQQECANKIGIKKSALCGYETGSLKNPTMESLIKLADALHMTIDGMVGREPPCQTIPMPEHIKEVNDLHEQLHKAQRRIKELEDTAQRLDGAGIDMANRVNAESARNTELENLLRLERKKSSKLLWCLQQMRKQEQDVCEKARKWIMEAEG